MIVKNLLVYTLLSPWTLSPGELEALLAQAQLQPCNGANTVSAGWVPPRDNGQLVYSFERHLVFAYGTEKKVIPKAAVDLVLDDRIKAYEQAQGRTVGRKMKRKMKQDVLDEIRPKALATRSAVRAWLDVTNNRLMIEATSVGPAEALILALKKLLPDFNVDELWRDRPVQGVLTGWLSDQEAPAPLSLVDVVELQSPLESKAKVRYSNESLTRPDILTHLREGKCVKALGLRWGESIQFVTDDRLSLKRLAFLEVLPDDTDSRDEDEAFDQSFAFTSGMVGRLLNDLETLMPAARRA